MKTRLVVVWVFLLLNVYFLLCLLPGLSVDRGGLKPYSDWISFTHGGGVIELSTKYLLQYFLSCQ